MSITRASIAIGLTVREPIGTDAAGYVNSSQNTVTYDGGNVDVALTGSTSPSATVHAVGKATLSTGAVTVDLTSLTGLNGVSVSLSGLKPRAVLFHNTGANDMTIAKGASNGYTGFGSSGTFTLPAGAKVAFYLGSNGTAVSGSVKTLDISGTGSQELKYQIVAGP